MTTDLGRRTRGRDHVTDQPQRPRVLPPDDRSAELPVGGGGPVRRAERQPTRGPRAAQIQAVRDAQIEAVTLALGWTVGADRALDALAARVVDAVHAAGRDTRCPTCDSPEPRLHPATQAEGEVSRICPDGYHAAGRDQDETWFTTADVTAARQRLADNRYGGDHDAHDLDSDDITEIIQIVLTATWQRAVIQGRDRHRSLERERLDLAKRALMGTGYFTDDQVSDDVAPRITELFTALTRDRAEVEQLRYERRLLGVARMTLDLVAAGDPTRWDHARAQAEDVAQRIVDEIGHPVTDEPALGPDLRAQLAEQRQRADQAEARGWAKAVQALRDDERCSAWRRKAGVPLTALDWIACNCAADYLEAVGPDGTASSVRVEIGGHDITDMIAGDPRSILVPQGPVTGAETGQDGAGVDAGCGEAETGGSETQDGQHGRYVVARQNDIDQAIATGTDRVPIIAATECRPCAERKPEVAP